jgi:phosphatidylglycerol---prolipoprotein diacylglyceryl transferase
VDRRTRARRAHLGIAVLPRGLELVRWSHWSRWRRSCVLVLKGWPIVPTLSAATPALAFGHSIGRIGCFLVGDDYGTPSDLPWVVAFPEGLPPTTVPVHPTQLYEAIGLGLLGWWLVRWRRSGVRDTIVLGRYLVGAGTLWFVIEFIRVNERVALGLSVAHVVSLVAIAAGIGMLVVSQPARRAAHSDRNLS